MTRVAYVCADRGVPVFGTKGCSVRVQEVVRTLWRRGISVTLFAGQLGGEPPRGLEGVPVRRLPAAAHHCSAAGREHAFLRSNTELRSEIERCGPFDVVYERHSLWSFAPMAWARDAGVPGLLEVSTPLVDEQRRHRRLVHPLGAGAAAERAFAAASAVLASTTELAAALERLPAAAGRVHVVPSGVDPARFARVGMPPVRRHGDFTVGFVGSPKAWHDVTTLIEAFVLLRGAVPKARLLVVSRGAHDRELERLLACHGVSMAATIVRNASAETMPRWMTPMDVAVAPLPGAGSGAGSGGLSPLNLLEYMAAARPTVASAVGHVGDVIRDGRDGILVPPGDPAALAAALVRLAGDGALRARMGASARTRVTRLFTWEAAIDRILELAGGEAADAGSPGSRNGTPHARLR